MALEGVVHWFILPYECERTNPALEAIRSMYPSHAAMGVLRSKSAKDMEGFVRCSSNPAAYRASATSGPEVQCTTLDPWALSPCADGLKHNDDLLHHKRRLEMCLIMISFAQKARAVQLPPAAQLRNRRRAAGGSCTALLSKAIVQLSLYFIVL